jgi:hypothetical protein
VVSSLAEGADRIFARAVLRANGQLEAILPLDPADYRADFDSATSKQEFADLLAQAVVQEVIPPEPTRPDSYQSAGKRVVDRSDVMVFLWDGNPAQGVGGTAEIYEYAQHRKKAIFWIRTDGSSAELMLEPRTRPMPLSPEGLRQLHRYNRERLPSSATRCPPLVNRLPESGSGPAKALTEHFWYFFARADSLATTLQRRWLRLTRLLYALAAIAVLIVAAQILFAPSHEHYAWFEFAVLLAVTVLLLLARFGDWRQRWISARYLAEQIRSLVFLALADATADGDTSFAGARSAGTEATSWTDRAVNEIWWSRPDYCPSDLEGLRQVLDEQWIGDQLRYHDKTSRRYEEHSRRFAWAAVGLFALSAVAALVHSIGIRHTNSVWGFLSIVVPAIGAALSGYAAQRDYARHAERSRLFAATLNQAQQQLTAAASFHDIQEIAASVAMLMRGEAGDWYSIVRLQEIEPP